jgi:Cu/Ag efflux protein CusF
MKKMLMIAAALAVIGSPLMAIAQSEPVQAQTQAQVLTDGEVTKIDQEAGKITIKHGPIKKLEMDEGMTMVFAVSDPALLKTVKAGDKIKFDADRVNGRFTVTKIEKAK